MSYQGWIYKYDAYDTFMNILRTNIDQKNNKTIMNLDKFISGTVLI